MNVNSNNRFKLMTIALLLSFVGIAVCFNMLHLIVGKVKESKIKVDETKRDIALIDKIAQENKQYSAEIQKVKNTLPLEYYEVSFFTTQVEKLAQNNSLELETRIDKDKKEEGAEYDSIIYSLEMKGGYPSISLFLSQLSKLPYHTKVEKMGIAYEEGSLVSKINFKLFVQK